MFKMFASKATIDSIVSDISAKIDQLSNLEVKHSQEATLIEAQIASMKVSLGDAHASSARAGRLAGKFRELIS